MAGVILYPHLARRLGKPIEVISGKDDNDIVTYERRNKVLKVGEGEDDYVIKEVVVEVSRVNRQKWIAKDAPDVGIMNILEKVRRSGDATLFNQTHAVHTGDVQDFVDVPEDIGEALRSVAKGASSFEVLKAIFGDVSFDKLAAMSTEDINNSFQAYLNSLKPEVKEESK